MSVPAVTIARLRQLEAMAIVALAALEQMHTNPTPEGKKDNVRQP